MTDERPRRRGSDSVDMCVVVSVSSVLFVEKNKKPTDSVCVTLLSSNCSILRSGGTKRKVSKTR
jgi:fructose-1,6-bisphosphatase/inositol monophosphatase family enzyme